MPETAKSPSSLEMEGQASSRVPEMHRGDGVAAPEVLLTATGSAYGARVFAGDDETVVVTPTQLIRLRGEQQEVHEVKTGHATAWSDEAIVFWRDGALRRFSLEKMAEAEVLPLQQEPKALVASGRRLAWINRDSRGHHAIQTSSAGSIVPLYSSPHSLSAPVLYEENVYFVEVSGESWKIGRAPLNGSGVSFSKAHLKRRPSSLAAGPDGIYFYDGPQRRVMRLSFDMRVEKTVGEGVICSPLAVSDRIVCAKLGGIFDIPRAGADPRSIARETSGPVADIAVSEDAIYWIADSGDSQLTVKSMTLPRL